MKIARTVVSIIIMIIVVVIGLLIGGEEPMNITLPLLIIAGFACVINAIENGRKE